MEHSCLITLVVEAILLAFELCHWNSENLKRFSFCINLILKTMYRQPSTYNILSYNISRLLDL